MKFSIFIAASYAYGAWAASGAIGESKCDTKIGSSGTGANPSDCDAIRDQIVNQEEDTVDGPFYFENGNCHFRSNNNPHDSTSREDRLRWFDQLSNDCQFYDRFKVTDVRSGWINVSDNMRVCMSSQNSCNN